MQNTQPWDPWLLVVDNSQPFTHREHSTRTANSLPPTTCKHGGKGQTNNNNFWAPPKSCQKGILSFSPISRAAPHMKTLEHATLQLISEVRNNQLDTKPGNALLAKPATGTINVPKRTKHPAFAGLK